jgi:hypothetical protein
VSILKQLQKNFPEAWFKDGHDFDGGTAAAWSGEGAMIGDMPAFDSNAWEWDSNENNYCLGVHNELRDFVEARGYFWEAYDAGTFLLYKV